MFWRNLWVECGRPRSRAVAEVMHRAWASNHYADCCVKLNERIILNERFAESYLSDNSRDFWSEVKRLRSTRSCPSCMIDDFTAPDDIASLFAKKNIKNCTPA